MFSVSVPRSTQRRLLVCLLLLTGLLAAGAGVLPTAAQVPGSDQPNTDRYAWLSAGIGGAQTGLGLTASVGRSLTSRSFIGARVAHTQEFVRFDAPEPTTWDVGPLIGLYTRGRYGHVSIASGLVAVGGRDLHSTRRPGFGRCTTCDEEYGPTHLRTIGVPVDVQVVVTPSPALGIGLHGYATVSPEENLLGFSIQLLARTPG